MITIIIFIIILLWSIYKKKYDFSPKFRNYRSHEVYFLDFSEASSLSSTDNKADTTIISTIAYLTLVCRWSKTGFETSCWLKFHWSNWKCCNSRPSDPWLSCLLYALGNTWWRHPLFGGHGGWRSHLYHYSWNKDRMDFEAHLSTHIKFITGFELIIAWN